jgi:Fic family protein
MGYMTRIGRTIKTTVGDETVSAYLPNDLPPSPSLALSEVHIDLMQVASQSLGRLDGASLMLPNVDLFTYMFLRKEALVSSQIEGTQSSFADLLLYESDQAPGVPVEDVEEVVNYVAALNHGIQRLEEGFPLSLRLIKEMHSILLQGVRGQEKLPGEFRRSQNWIGGARPGKALFVPPPPDHVMTCMSALEKFLHNDPVATSPLVKAALSHVQFETIHPFLDGNGRVGRLLMTLILYAESVLRRPSLYLSLYFKANRQQYYDLLQRVRLKGEWEAWLSFFLTAVKETSDQAVQTIETIQHLFYQDEEKLLTHRHSSKSVVNVYRYMQKRPITTIAQCVKALASTVPTVTKGIEQLITLNIVKELTGQERNRLFSYAAYVQILSEGADPIIS